MSVLGTDRRVLVLAFARMADAMGNSFLIVILPLYIASGQIAIDAIVGTSVLGVQVTESLLIGIALSLFGFLNSFSQPFVGRLSDRLAKRKAFILVGLALLGTASGVYIFVSSYWAVLVLRALQGIGAALTIPSTVALVNELATSASERGGNFGVFNTFRLIGFGFGPVVAGLVVDIWGYHAAFGVAVAGAFFSFLLVAALVSDTEETKSQAGEDLSIAVLGPGDRLLDPVFALGIGTVVMGIAIAMFATLEAQINARLDQPTYLFGLQFGAVTIANLVAQIPVGRASDVYGRRPFLLVGFLLLVPSTAAQGYVTTIAGMVVVRLVQGVAVAMVFAPSLALAGDLAKKGASGTTLSVLTMSFGLGTALGPLTSGYLVSFGFAVPFVVGAVLAVGATWLVYSQVDETLESARSLPFPK
ncbi:MFS transporter [Halanaeroarchaeum sulfurireducens]|uniref:Major facilitator superfamily MFS 1 n=1 Tax=Halanaeroarchaeum sulfurireducens TaxID=1604004 RepID=A0A0F7PC85_9EURY|nr:MFS transporter [Halanaeroarchaeum sulfurireducens]AKH97224.1 major facilitator superfamily MFS 1 [Halanaeroarchaeum sulfurireducens]ALG81626.1 major facilitator superfamily MFS 1 [Halanaeroarchaeum sulfurireducens]